MSLQYRCDRCNQPIVGTSFALTIQQHKEQERYATYNGIPDHADLCQPCAKALQAFLDPTAVQSAFVADTDAFVYSEEEVIHRIPACPRCNGDRFVRGRCLRCGQLYPDAAPQQNVPKE